MGLGLLASVAFGGPARAATYDPDLTWRTLVTENFRIHFHQGEEQLAEEFSLMVEQVLTTMSAELRWKPRMKTEVVLIDRTDSANGFASAVPYNAITIFVTAPQEDSTLSLYEDWSETIFTHELSHVLHLETHHGIVAVARAVVGRIASTNDVSPWWMIEGLATFQETRHTAGGRGRAPQVDMIKRTAVVDDAFPPLGNLDGLQAQQPSGNLRYLFGQDFMQYIADHTGEDVWTRWTHRYGSHVPFLLPSRKAFGRILHGLYDDWREHSFARYRTQVAEIEAEGLREGRLVSNGTASCTAPAFAPDDSRLIWSCYDIRTGSALWTAEGDGSGARILKQDFGAKYFTWRADSKAFVYAATHIVNRFNTWSDIYLFDLASGSVSALTSGARARDPDFSPDGSRLWMVTNRAQDNQLESLTVDRRRTALTDHADHTQYATPRFSPDGSVVAVSVWEQGRRDLWLLRNDGTRLRRLTHDVANDRDPAWSPDGRWLFFNSDRSGVPNVYAIDTTDEHLWQVTNVRTGAALPSVNADGTLLAYQQYSADGWDIRLLDLDPARWLDRGTLAFDPSNPAPLHTLFEATADAPAVDLTAWRGEPIRERGPGSDPRPQLALDPHQSAETLDTFEQARVKDAFGEEEDYPFTIKPRRYNPWPSLIPRYWVPGIAVTPRLYGIEPVGPFAFLSRWPAPFNIPGLQVSAATSASDPLRHYAWSGFLTYRTDANFVGGGGSFTLNRWLPVFSLTASTAAVPRTYQVVDLEATALDAAGEVQLDPLPRSYFERRISAALTMSYPFTARSTVFASYDFSERTAITSIDPNALAESVPLRGTLGRLSAGYRYAWARPTGTAISPEDARTFSLVGAITAPWLGAVARADDGTTSGITQVQLSAELREYLVNPLAPNHVFALRAAAGVALGRNTQYVGNYQLGGNIGDGAFYVRPAEYRMIRGYPFGADRGDNYWLAAAEYRFPIWRMDRGIGTLPAFFRVLHGAVFVDAGNAFNQVVNFVDVFDDTLVGVGAELRLSTVLWWSGSLDMRLGYGVGLTGPAIGPTDPRSVYFQLGGAF
jgi:hypothetical protein